MLKKTTVPAGTNAYDVQVARIKRNGAIAVAALTSFGAVALAVVQRLPMPEGCIQAYSE